MPPRLSLSWIHKRNSHLKNPHQLRPWQLKVSLANFKTKLIERGYKIQEIDQYFNEALLHDRKSLLAHRPKNKWQNPLGVHYQIPPSPQKHEESPHERMGPHKKQSPTTTVPEPTNNSLPTKHKHQRTVNQEIRKKERKGRKANPPNKLHTKRRPLTMNKRANDL